MKNLINEILEEIGLEKLRIKPEPEQAQEEPLKVSNKRQLIDLIIDSNGNN